jgi:hypothetical protein
MSRSRARIAEEPDQTEASDLADESPREPLGSTTGRKRMRTGRPTKDRSKIIRATYESTEELEWRLNGLAKHLRCKKYDLVFKLLDQGCSGFKIDEYLKSAALHILGESVKVA